jgi:uncharacterized membrane protein YkvA (DUF1232 family)
MNRFFSYALKKASEAIRKPGRLSLLLSQLAVKSREVNWRQVSVNSAREKISTLGRLIKAYSAGQYKSVPLKTILLIVAAIVYFINPIDLIPDMLPLTGFTDDFGILLWIYNAVNVEIQKFLTWEKSQVLA